MFNIGVPELLLIFSIALIVLGPKKLPQLARTLGKVVGEFKKAADDLKENLNKEIDETSSSSTTHSSLENTPPESEQEPEKKEPIPQEEKN